MGFEISIDNLFKVSQNSSNFLLVLPKNILFDWTLDYHTTLDILKKIVTETLTFAYAIQDLRTIVKTDFSNYITHKALFQLGKDELLYPVAFFPNHLNSVNLIMRFIKKGY